MCSYAQLKAELMKVASQSAVTQSSDVTHKLLRDKQHKRCQSVVCFQNKYAKRLNNYVTKVP